MSYIHKLLSSFCVLFFLAFFFNAHEANSEDQPIVDEIEGWKIGIDTSLGNGCFMLGEFDGGSIIRIGFDMLEEASGYMILGDADWTSLERGKEYTLQFQFGKESPWDGDAIGFNFPGHSSTFLKISFSDPNFLKEFMKKHSMIARYKNKEIMRISLRGSHKAGEGLISCQSYIEDLKEEQNDPFVANPKLKMDPFSD